MRDGEGRHLSFYFSDVDGIREALGTDTLERTPSDTQLMIVGLPHLVIRPVGGRTLVQPEDYLRETEWSIASSLNGLSVSQGAGIFDEVAPRLEANGWTREGDLLREGAGGPRSVNGVLVRKDDTVVAGRDETVVDGAGSSDLGDEEPVAALRDCLGQEPLAVSLVVLPQSSNGYRAYGVTTERDGDGLVTRSCALVDDPDAVAAALPDRETVNEPLFDPVDIETDGDVVSARLVPRDGTPAPHATAHLALPESLAPGF